MSLFDTVTSFLGDNASWLVPAAGAAATIYGANKAATANREAGEAQAAASREASALQAAQYQQAQERQRPYAELGDQAAGQLQQRLSNNSLLGRFSPEDLANEPGYQFELSEGNKAIDRAAGARGGRYSGATLKDLQRFGQNVAQQNYGQAYQRDALDKQRQFNMLSDTARTGQGATGQASTYGVQGANALAGGVLDASRYRGAGNINANNSLNEGYSQLGAGALDYWSNR